MGRACFKLFFGPPQRCPSTRTLSAQRGSPARARLRSVPPRRSFVAQKARSWEPGRQRWWPVPAPLGLQAPRLPGQGLRRCFSNSDSSSKNSNQQVCGGVQGRLEVAASRSAASALILPPPPLPPGTLPGSNLTLGRRTRGSEPRDYQDKAVLHRSGKPTQLKMAASAWIRLLEHRHAPGQSWLQLGIKRAGSIPHTTPPPCYHGR